MEACIKVTIESDSFGSILLYLDKHLDESYKRVCMDIGRNEVAYGVIEDFVVYDEIQFKITCNDCVYKQNDGLFRKYYEIELKHARLEYIKNFIEKCIDYNVKKSWYNNLSIFNSFYSTWSHESFLSLRDISKVYLPQKIKENVIEDITNFNNPKVIERYSQLGINHTRIYMLYGPPGTGKTSLIRSIATYFKKNLCYFNIEKDTNDNNIKSCLKKIPDNSIICIEDIDEIFPTDKNAINELTFSGFLNCFDGFSTPNNLIIFMTTNHLPKLENAIIRRISYFIEFKYAVKEQIKQMFETFFPEYSFESFYQNVKNHQVTINVLKKFFTRYLLSDIVEESKNFSKFVNGELKTENSNIEKFYT